MIRRVLDLVAVIVALAAVAIFDPPVAFGAVNGDADLGGTVTATIKGKKVHFPLLKTDIDADVQGDLASVTITQTFANPLQRPLNATYLFPLTEEAAVYAMEMEIGDERVVARIKRRAEARKTFETAKRDGKAAALLTQHRPNMFTQEIANLMPGKSIKVTIRYTHVVPRKDGAYELVMPLVVGPRYNPERMVKMVSAKRDRGGPVRARPPAYPDVAGLTIPDAIDKDRVSIRVALKSGVPVQAVTSETHGVKVTGSGTSREVTLFGGRTIDNRDFILRYHLAGAAVDAGLLTHRDRTGGYFNLMLEPPKAPASEDITPREMVFVLDTSGSMTGLPMDASKEFMRRALKTLRPGDYFRIIRFSNTASELAKVPVPATPENIRAGTQFVDGLSAGGGTEIPNAIARAFAPDPAQGTLRIVVFLSDGYIGNEQDVLDLIARDRRDARIYAFGVGTGINRYLLTEMARAGRGFARIVDPTKDDGQTSAAALAERLDMPVLTDIDIDWGELDAVDVQPGAIPDLFAGDSIRIQGRFKRSGTHEIVVSGKQNGRPVRLPMTVTLPDSEDADDGEAIRLIWARTQVAELMRKLAIPAASRGRSWSDTAIEEKVTNLGLVHALVTQWTSFVAVTEKIVNRSPVDAVDADVPLHKVEGITGKAYGVRAQPPMPGQQAMKFTGGATPEPHVVIAMAMLLVLAWWMLMAGNRRNRRVFTCFRRPV